MSHWKDDPGQGLLEEVLQGITNITTGVTEYEGAEVRQSRPQFRDTDLPLQIPIISVEPVTDIASFVAFNDLLRDGQQGHDVLALYLVSVWTSRGKPNNPRSGSGGIGTANRLLGQLSNDINLDVQMIPDGIRKWKLDGLVSGTANIAGRTPATEAVYDMERDLYEAQGLLMVESEVWRRTGHD